jgi:hypothetical protein
VTGWVFAALALLTAIRAGSVGWFLISLAAAVVNVGSLYLWPLGPCLKCKGTGRNQGSNRKRFGECRRCNGTGRRQRTGARLVHRGAVTLAERARKKGIRP